MKRIWSGLAVLALAGLARAAGGGVGWESPEAAFPTSAVTGKPICWYFTTDAMGAGGGT